MQVGVIEFGHVCMEEGLGNPVIVFRVSSPLCIQTHYCYHHFSINQSINTQLINFLGSLIHIPA